MNIFTKAVVLGTVAVATLASTFEAASAGDRYWQRRGYHDRSWHSHRSYKGDAFAAGVLGVTAGVVLGSMLTDPGPDVVYSEEPAYRREVIVEDRAGGDEYLGPVDEYAEPDAREYVVPRSHRRVVTQAQDDNYYPDRPQKQRISRNTDVAQQQTLEPWTAQWRSYCKQRFGSFNATTGTYTGYDGKSHFCTAG